MKTLSHGAIGRFRLPAKAKPAKAKPVTNQDDWRRLPLPKGILPPEVIDRIENGREEQPPDDQPRTEITRLPPDACEIVWLPTGQKKKEKGDEEPSEEERGVVIIDLRKGSCTRG